MQLLIQNKILFTSFLDIFFELIDFKVEIFDLSFQLIFNNFMLFLYLFYRLA